jgi:hypothetical protein
VCGVSQPGAPQYQQPQPAQVALQHTPIPRRPLDPQQKTNVAPSVIIPAFDIELTLVRASRNVPLQPAERLRSNEFVPLKLEWESLDDQPLLEK